MIALVMIYPSLVESEAASPVLLPQDNEDHDRISALSPA